MTIPAILSAETSERIATVNLRATLALLQYDIARFLADADCARGDLSQLYDVLTAAMDQAANVERARDDVADLKDEYAHATLMMARRAA
jgi:hypothetical protein